MSEPLVRDPGNGYAISASDPVAAAGEAARDRLAFEQANERQTWRADTETRLAGNPAAWAALMAAWAPVIEFYDDLRTPAIDLDAEDDGIIVNLGAEDGVTGSVTPPASPAAQWDQIVLWTPEKALESVQDTRPLADVVPIERHCQSVDGCERDIYLDGLCVEHYREAVLSWHQPVTARSIR